MLRSVTEIRILWQVIDVFCTAPFPVDLRLLCLLWVKHMKVNM